MMKTLAIIIVAALFISVPALAQKLPKTQEISVRPPANVKIDGNAGEWKLQAFNNHTNVFYTLANDDERLYLVIKATDALTIRKMIAGGVTLVINADKEMDHNNPVNITYPLLSQKNWPVVNLRDKPVVVKDSAGMRPQIDSFMRASNRQLSDRSKEIKLTGARGLSDSLVSVYNDEGIKAAALFDKQLAYNYELAVPLKYLGLSFKGQLQFSYRVKLNGASFSEGAVIEQIDGGTRVRWDSGKATTVADMQYINNTTDFWGNYTLVKKDR